MSGGRDEERKKNKKPRTKQREEKRAVKIRRKKERDVLSPGCQAEPKSVLLAV